MEGCSDISTCNDLDRTLKPKTISHPPHQHGSHPSPALQVASLRPTLPCVTTTDSTAERRFNGCVGQGLDRNG